MPWLNRSPGFATLGLSWTPSRQSSRGVSSNEEWSGHVPRRTLLVKSRCSPIRQLEDRVAGGSRTHLKPVCSRLPGRQAPATLSLILKRSHESVLARN